MINMMDLENSSMINIHMKGTLKMVCFMAKSLLSFIKMGKDSLDTSIRGISILEDIYLLMEAIMKDNLKIIYQTGLEISFGLMGLHIQESGKIVCRMESD